MELVENKADEEVKMQIENITLLEDSDDLEKRNVLLMRKLVELEEPSSKDEDDLMLRRFLRAREQDVERASKMFVKYVRWRKSFVPNGSINPTDIPNELGQNKFFLQGTDKHGRPIGVILGCRHKKTSLLEFKNYAVYSLDKMCGSLPKGVEKFVCIADAEGWGYSNLDLRAYAASLSILQDCYPERLGKLYMVHVPYVFMAVWNLISRFIDNKTKTKIVFVDDKLLKRTLLEEIDENQLPKIYGGKMELVPIQDC
uniref:CRAL-TRIO domain-containing protein n=1 Tax=Kalanchoe fedtschenkoi TaxID=63787 RepID=A0A7N0UN12_KALFE